jgi:glycosyltransferase involved in cell wall biosynthesis
MTRKEEVCRVSVIMPAMNDELNIARAVADVVSGFSGAGVSGEIIIVNDGSRDRTGKIAEEFGRTYPFVTVVHHEKNSGIGAAFRSGLQRARGEFVTMLPGDGENSTCEILRYLPLMDQVDIVIPFVYNRGVRTPVRRLVSIIYREIIKASFGLSLNYMNGTVLYRANILQDITFRSAGFFYQTELLIKAILSGYLYAEVPYALLWRNGGESKATSLRSLLKVMRSYIVLLGEIYMSGWKKSRISPDTATARRWKELEELTTCRAK